MECAPSRARTIAPSIESKGTPSRIRSAMRSGASRVRISTLAGSQRPAPARAVSSACRRGVSPGPMGAAMPPWAYCVLQSCTLPLVRTSTLADSEARSAV